MENANSGNCPTQTLVDAYEMKNGGEPDPANPYESPLAASPSRFL